VVAPSFTPVLGSDHIKGMNRFHACPFWDCTVPDSAASNIFNYFISIYNK
jgi:hypothetical protein